MNRFKSFAVLAAMAGFATAAAAGSLVFSPPASGAMVGELVVVEVRGVGFSGNLVGGGFDLSFDPTIVSLSSVDIAVAEWELVSNPGTISNAAGTLSSVWFNAFADPLPTGSFAVATLRFNSLAPGVAALNLSASGNFPFVNDQIELVAVSFGSGSITVSAVPDISSWASLTLGLALLPWLRRRRTHS